MNTQQLLENFDISQLDPLELRMYVHHIQSMPKADALQILINSVEGDLTQLNPMLFKVANEIDGNEE